MGPIERLRFASRAVGFGAWTLGVVYGHKGVARFDEELQTWRGRQTFIHAWSQGVFPIFGVRLSVVDGVAPRVGGPYVVISNHRSPLDILVSVHLAGGVVLSHAGVRSIPVIRTAAEATDTIFVDRDDTKSGARAIRTMRRRLKEGRNVIVFPEGTTFAGDQVRPFKRGAFSAAKGLDAKVLPIGVAYRRGDEFVDESFGRHLSRMSSRPETPIWATVGEPVPVPKNAGEEEELRRLVQGLVGRSASARDEELG